MITAAREAGLVTKSNLILGMGEEPHEVVETMQALHDAGCDLLTITQYLRPSPRHHPVVRWVKPEEFVGFQAEAERIGFPGVLAGPLVRSSYRAGRLYQQADRGPRARPPGLTPARAASARASGARRGPILGAWHAASPQTRPLPAARPAAARRTPAAAAPRARRLASGKAARSSDKKGQPKVGRLKKLSNQVGMIKQAYTLTRKNDPKLPWIMLIAFVVVAGVVELVGILLGSPFLFLPLAVITGGARRADHLRPARAGLGLPPGRGPAGRGRLGARGHARRLAGHLRRRRHRAARRRPPGARPPRRRSWSAEGAPSRVRGLLAQEKKKVARIVGDTPIYDIVVGDDEGQVPLRKLSAHVMKLPRNLVRRRGQRPRPADERHGRRAACRCPAARCPAASRCRSASARSAAAADSRGAGRSSRAGWNGLGVPERSPGASGGPASCRAWKYSPQRGSGGAMPRSVDRTNPNRR